MGDSAMVVDGASSEQSSTLSISDRAVLHYLKSRGYHDAAISLSQTLAVPPPSSSSSSAQQQQQQQQQTVPAPLAHDLAAVLRYRRTHLALLGSSSGYSLDASPSVLFWGLLDGDPLRYTDAFATLQAWILSLGLDSSPSSSSSSSSSFSAHLLPPSSLSVSPKLELMTVSFVLLCHIYVELIESGFEESARPFLSQWSPLFSPLFPEDLNSLSCCRSLVDVSLVNDFILNLPSLVREQTSSRDATSKLLASRACVLSESTDGILSSPQSCGSSARKLQDLNAQLLKAQDREREIECKAKDAKGKVSAWDFVTRLRSHKAHLQLSEVGYTMLSSFLGRQNLIPITAILFSRCVINVSSKVTPRSFVPAVVLADILGDAPGLPASSAGGAGSQPYSSSSSSSSSQPSSQSLNLAAPLPQPVRASLEGVPPSSLPQPSFPPYSASGASAAAPPYGSGSNPELAASSPAFNMSLLKDGFRRLNALEAAIDRESYGTKESIPKSIKAPRAGKEAYVDPNSPFMPSIALSRVSVWGGAVSTSATSSCSSSYSTNNNNNNNSDALAPGDLAVGITCLALSPSDGRRVAAGGEDSTIQVWNLRDRRGSSNSNNNNNNNGGGGSDVDAHGTAPVKLRGHANGRPVYALSWFKDARSLLSAAADGTVRLWDANVAGHVPPSSFVSGRAVEGLDVLGSTSGGAALAAYKGHVPGTGVYGVAASPSGYYFASCGGDATARLWCTDRLAPVRIFAGHLSSVNCVAFHPNVNYIATGGDDQTARLWDVQSGKCARLLTGFHGAVKNLAFCPSGKYLSASDARGVVHVFDLSTSNKLSELRPSHEKVGGIGLAAASSAAEQKDASSSSSSSSALPRPVYSLAYSSCGSCVAAGGRGGVHLYDVRRAATPSGASMGGAALPVKGYAVDGTDIFDMHFTNANVLICGGRWGQV